MQLRRHSVGRISANTKKDLSRVKTDEAGEGVRFLLKNPKGARSFHFVRRSSVEVTCVYRGRTGGLTIARRTGSAIRQHFVATTREDADRDPPRRTEDGATTITQILISCG